jgi:hypothetical protein
VEGVNGTSPAQWRSSRNPVDPKVAAQQLYDALKPHYPDLKRDAVNGTTGSPPAANGRTVLRDDEGAWDSHPPSKNGRVDVDLPTQPDGTLAPAAKKAMRQLLNDHPELELGVGLTNPQNRPLGIDADGFPKLDPAVCWAPRRGWGE